MNVHFETGCKLDRNVCRPVNQTTHQQHGVVRGGARGAAAGAANGAVAGGMKRGFQQRDERMNAQTGAAAYDQAFRVCLAGRGYTLR